MVAFPPRAKERMKLPFFWVDAFSRHAFGGNPAGVCLLERWLEAPLMQRVAWQNGLAETAFVVPQGGAGFYLRWFTPSVEVDLCGHATLATAHVLISERNFAAPRMEFHTRSGVLGVTRVEDEKLELDFPSTPVTPAPNFQPALERALRHPVLWTGKSRFDWFAALATETDVRNLQPDLLLVAQLGMRGLIVTAPGTAGVDFVSRFFAPQSGITEDPVTGSAHSALTPFWSDRLGKTELSARQISSRGGQLWCRLRGDRVGIAGHCATYLRGELDI
jgi:PhzF family phenazine biosynthesis protein